MGTSLQNNIWQLKTTQGHLSSTVGIRFWTWTLLRWVRSGLHVFYNALASPLLLCTYMCLYHHILLNQIRERPTPTVSTYVEFASSCSLCDSHTLHNLPYKRRCHPNGCLQLRRVLIGLGLPSAGTLSKLQARALAVSDAVENGLSVEAGLKSAKALR